MNKLNEDKNSDFEKDIIKLPFRSMALEITRKCNMKCPHCMRGKPQNQVLNKKVIDKFLDEIGTVQNLLLTGGEPFLEPEIIEYLVDEIVKRKSRILTFSCVTNGSICNDKIINSFNKLSDYIATEFGEFYTSKGLRNIGSISISNDIYHSKVNLDETAKFYRERANKHIIIFKGKQDNVEYLIASGNAITNHLTDDKSKDIIYHICPYRVTIKDDMIDNSIEITCDGNLTYSGDYSYEKIDSYIFGNILNEHISDILLSNCHHQMFTEEEAKSYDYFYSSLKMKHFEGNWTQKHYEEALYYFDIVYEKRIKVAFLFPFLKYEEIVKLAYDILNVSLRKNNRSDKIFCIDNLDEYDATLEESLKHYNEIKKIALKKNPLKFWIIYWKVSLMDVGKVSDFEKTEIH